MIKSTKTTRMF